MPHRRLARPFLTTVATAATLLAATGCGSNVVFDGEGSGGDATTGGGSAQGGSHAQGGSSQGGSGAGGSDPLPCPVDKPVNGSSCDGMLDGQTCEYLSDPPCPEITVGAVCDAGLWAISEPECNPPPPVWGCEVSATTRTSESDDPGPQAR